MGLNQEPMMVPPQRRFVAVLLAMTTVIAAPARAAEALVAVAANFVAIAETLVQDFETDSGHRLVLTSGSTGKLYAQIVNGAPYDLFLAADRERPAKLTDAGLTEGDPATYARGRLGIWIPGQIAVPSPALTDLNRVALANPALAPYGVAAMDVLHRLDPAQALKGRLVYGENVAQAYAMVASGAAQAGVVAWSTLMDAGAAAESWQVPADWHQPIDQDAVLLSRGAGNEAARAFFVYLFSPAARTVIESRGYLTP